MVYCISIHAAREGGDLNLVKAARWNVEISIHAAREGGDPYAHMQNVFRNVFQSTPPVKAATATFSAMLLEFRISIHAAREGGDVSDGEGGTVTE